MSNVKTASTRLLAAIMAVCLAVVMAVGAASLLAPPKAFADEQAVRNTASGVMKINWALDNNEWSRGSCFLINEDTVLTAYHCTFFDTNELVTYGYDGQDVQELRKRATYSVTINRDVTVGATLVNWSEEQDFAILKLDQKIANHTPLTIRDSLEVKAAEAVYSIGYPAVSDVGHVIKTYTASDATIKGGTASKSESVFNLADAIIGYNYYWVRDNMTGYYIQTDINLLSGDSGGPVVDANGYVVGVNVRGSDNFAYAAATDVIMPVLSDLGIQYTSSKTAKTASEKHYTLSTNALSTEISKAEAVDSSKYTSDSYKAVTDALATAKDAKNLKLKDDTDESEYKEAQATIDDAASALNAAVAGLKEAPTGPSVGVIIGIIAAVVIVLAVVIALVVRSRKKKKQEEAPTVPLGSPAASSISQPSLQSGGAQTWQKPGAIPAAANGGANETTILEEEANDTVILFQAASGGSLTRMSTNEQIPINSAEFTIGRERSKVNYCLEGNSSISRVHVRIVVRDGKSYLIDNRAANGTYINGVKCRPGEETLLKGGDIITLADEKFKYNA